MDELQEKREHSICVDDREHSICVDDDRRLRMLKKPKQQKRDSEASDRYRRPRGSSARSSLCEYVPRRGRSELRPRRLGRPGMTTITSPEADRNCVLAGGRSQQALRGRQATRGRHSAAGGDFQLHCVVWGEKTGNDCAERITIVFAFVRKARRHCTAAVCENGTA